MVDGPGHADCTMTSIMVSFGGRAILCRKNTDWRTDFINRAFSRDAFPGTLRTIPTKSKQTPGVFGITYAFWRRFSPPLCLASSKLEMRGDPAETKHKHKRNFRERNPVVRLPRPQFKNSMSNSNDNAEDDNNGASKWR